MVPVKGLDFGFCGNAYEAANPYQDRQRTLNYYVEVSQDEKSKEKYTLLGVPGLNPILSLGTGEVRGCWVLPGGQNALWVRGNTVYLIATTVPATQISIAQFSATSIGTLLTNTGPVIIRDNGSYAVLVDGLYGYYYRIAGAGTVTFSATTTTGNAALSVAAPFPAALIVGSAVSGAGIPGGALITAVDFNALTVTLSAAATAPATVTVTMTAAAFAQITDPAFLGADRVAYIDGWFLFNQPGTANFYSTAPYAYTLMFAGSFFAKNDSSSGNVVTLMENNREAWIVGERHSEIWYDAGGTNFSFQRIPGAAPQIGCAAKHSIARLGDDLVWLGRSERGENVVVKTEQYSYLAITNRAIEHAISSYPYVADAIGYTYLEEGHLFYVLTFPTADATWVYDHTTSLATGTPAWHQRASYNQTTGAFHRHRSNCYTNFQNLRLVGDYQSGQIHQLSRDIFTDAGDPLPAIRRAPHIWSKSDRKRLFYSSLQIEFAPGVGLQVGQGVNPQAMLKQSNDAGATFGPERWTSIGLVGQTKNRAIWRRLSFARDTVFEVTVTDPVKRDIIGASLFVDGEN